MFCNKCGNKLEPNSKFCNKCGNKITTEAQKENSLEFAKNLSKKIVSNKNKIIILVIFVVAISLIILGINKNKKYYFDINEEKPNNEIIQVSNESPKKSKYKTVIVYDNTYSGVEIKGKQDALNLIQKDSISQKDNCPTQIRQVEDQMIKDYDITAINLCEMDVDFAKELGNVFKKIYKDYPSVKGYFTNLTLVNVSMTDSYIAAFMPVFNFATSNTENTYPWVIKTQMLLNTSYFLNKDRLEASVTDGSNSGHFPKNSTIYSPIAHELGHYLSFLAMMKHYKLSSILLIDNNNLNSFYKLYGDFGEGNYSLTMIKEAYENYKKDNNDNINLDEWRGTISNYALAKDNSGDYIYDETIAESFHDVYLNGNQASDASKYIVEVLKEKLEG